MMSKSDTLQERVSNITQNAQAVMDQAGEGGTIYSRQIKAVITVFAQYQLITEQQIKDLENELEQLIKDKQ